MIRLDKDGCLPDGTHDVVGKLQEIVVPNGEIEEFCKNIIKNEFMDKVNEWGCDFEDILDEEKGMGDTYALALRNADWNCTKYYVYIDDDDNNKVRLFKVIDISENVTDEILEIKENDDNTYDFHLKFFADDELCSLASAMDYATYCKL